MTVKWPNGYCRGHTLLHHAYIKFSCIYLYNVKFIIHLLAPGNYFISQVTRTNTIAITTTCKFVTAYYYYYWTTCNQYYYNIYYINCYYYPISAQTIIIQCTCIVLTINVIRQLLQASISSICSIHSLRQRLHDNASYEYGDLHSFT